MFISFGAAPGEDLTAMSCQRLAQVRENFFATKERALKALDELHPSKRGVTEFLRTFDEKLEELDGIIKQAIQKDMKANTEHLVGTDQTST